MAAGDVFKLLVAAAVFVVVLALALSILLPLLQQPSDLGKEIKDGFENAKAIEGRVSESKALTLNSGQSVNAKAFEDNDTVAVLECNNPSICCIDSSLCKSELEVKTASRILLVNRPINVKTYYRCMYSHNLYVCRAFFGMKPAQAEIVEFEAPASIDLSKGNKLEFSVEYRNSGETGMLSPLIITVQAFDSKDRSPARPVLFESISEIAGVKAGDENSAKAGIVLGNSGSFDVKVKIESEESGLWEKSFKIEASGIPHTDCVSVAKVDTFMYPDAGSIEELRGECVSKALCDKCETSFECRTAWLSRAGSVVSAGNEYAYIIESPQACEGQ